MKKLELIINNCNNCPFFRWETINNNYDELKVLYTCKDNDYKEINDIDTIPYFCKLLEK